MNSDWKTLHRSAMQRFPAGYAERYAWKLLREGISIMISELGNYEGIIFNLINDAVLIRNSTRPISREAMFQGFRFPYPLVWHPFNVSN